jgi:hypothetical protein
VKLPTKQATCKTERVNTAATIDEMKTTASEAKREVLSDDAILKKGKGGGDCEEGGEAHRGGNDQNTHSEGNAHDIPEALPFFSSQKRE